MRKLVALLLILLAVPLIAQTFQPSVNVLGFVNTDQQIDWVIEVSNSSGVEGTDIRIVSRLPATLAPARVSASKGEVTIDEQIVTVRFPTLQPDEKILITITTDILSSVNHRNSVCFYAANLETAQCVNAVAIGQLPATGETPIWRSTMMLTAFVTLLAFVVSVVLRSATAFYAR